jgi:hypothetical protein
MEIATFSTWVRHLFISSLRFPRFLEMRSYAVPTDRNVWEPIETQGQVPSARFGHSCCPSPASTKEFILFGGHGIGNKHYNELHFFNTGTNALSVCSLPACQPDPSPSPTLRNSHLEEDGTR